MSRWSVPTILALVVLAGCAETRMAQIKPISRSSIGAVIAETKRQLGVYTAYQRTRFPDIIRDSRSKVCGNGLIGMDVDTAKLELATTTEGTVGGGISVAGVPTGGVVLGGGISASRVTTDSQTLTITSEVLLSTKAINYQKGMLEKAPIAATLANFWDATLTAGDTPSDVCLKLKKGDGNSYKISLSIVDDGKGNISIGLAPAVLTANGELKSTTGNTITVTFVPHDFSKPFPRRPRRGQPNTDNAFDG